MEILSLSGDFEQIFRFASDAMMLLDVDSLTIVEANHKAEQLYGYSRLELMGRCALDLVPEYLHDIMWRNAYAMNNGLKSLKVSDRPRLRKDGTEIRVQISAGIIEIGGKRVFQEIIRDETVRIQREDTLRSHAAELTNINTKLIEEVAKSTIAAQQFEELSLTDALTGLSNRRAFDERFENDWRRAIRSTDDVTIAVIDIDHFKKVNDRFGHLVGDELLSLVARTLQHQCHRAGDFIARFGGEEFVILTTDHSADSVGEWCEHLRKTVEALNLVHDGENLRLTVSIGVCSSPARKNQSRYSLLETADEALYEAKRSGRNRVAMNNFDLDLASLDDADAAVYETERVQALKRSNLLDTPPEFRFDRITRLATRLFDVPTAVVSLVDADRQWFKSVVGLNCDQTDRNVSLCTHAIRNDTITVIPDATLDSQFSASPLVIGEPYIRFYAGCPIWSPDKYRLGTLCIVDTKPRDFSDADVDALYDLASIARQEILATPRESS